MGKMLRKFILFAIFFMVVGSLIFSLFLKDRIEAYIQRFPSTIEEKLSQVLEGDVSIQGARAGFFDHLTIEGLRISTPLDSKHLTGSTTSRPGPVPIVEVGEVVLNYRFIDILFCRFDRPRLIKLVSPTFRFEGRGEARPFEFWGGLVGVPNVLVRDGRIIWRDAVKGLCLERGSIHGTIKASPTKVRVRFGSEEDLYLFGNIYPRDKVYNLTLRLNQLNLKSLSDSSIPVGQITGEIWLDEKRIRSDGLSASIYDLQVNLSGEVSHYMTDPKIDLSLSAKNRYLDGRFTAQGDLHYPRLCGTFNLNDRITFPFQATVDRRTRYLEFGLGGERMDKLKLFARLIDSGLKASLKLKHFDLGDLDIVTELNLEAQRNHVDGDYFVVGRLWSQNSILNYKPFRELEGSYVLDDGVLEITSLALEDVGALSGSVSLSHPFVADLTLRIDGLDMRDLLVFAKDAKEDAMSGRIEGELKVTGPLTLPDIKGRFVVTDGNLGEIEYRSMVVNLEGKGSLIAVKDSRIHQEEGSLSLEGVINLAKANVYEDVVVKSEKDRIIWQGWDITKPEYAAELRMQKAVGEDFRIDFKTYLNDELAFANPKGEETSLEYGLTIGERVKMYLKGDEEFLGLEHRLRF